MTSDKNEDGDGETVQVNESNSSKIEAKFEPIYVKAQKSKIKSQGKLENPSYVSSCSESSFSIENEKRNVELKNSGLSCDETGLHEANEKIDGAQEKSLTWSRSIDQEANVSPFERHVQSNTLGSDVDTCSSAELPPEVLTNRIESLESQLASLQLQLSTVLKSFESKATLGKRPIEVPKVHRVSSILLNDLHETSDAEQEPPNIEHESSPEKPGRDSSPVPNLEYRSYTPTYEEELLKYRKTSRGMSMDNSVEIEKKLASYEINKTKSKVEEDLKNNEAEDKTSITSKPKGYDDSKRNETPDKRENSSQITVTQNEDESCNKGGKPKDDNLDSFHADEEKQKLGFLELKWKSILAFFDGLNLDSRQHDGSATEEVDANMEEFLRVPWRIEELMSFGTIICADAFLHVLTVTPLKFIWSCLCLVCTILNPGKGIGWCRFHRRHLYQFVRVFVIYAVYKYCLSPISIGKMYHWIRGQAMLKLYVLMAMVEVFDRLMCSFGQDALDSLFWNTTRRPFHPRMLLSILVVLGYAIIHSYILFVHVATLNVAMNSADQTLLTLLISGNFAEIKSTVFKKYNKQNLFKIVSSDICERFKLVLFLGLVLLLNCSQGGMNQEMVNEYIHMSLLIFLAEMLCDWIKHSFITKFNFIKSSAYQHYALILAGDITGVGQDGLNIDHTHKVVKRLGFAQIPLACVMARYVAEAVRYADTLSDDGDSNHVLYSIAVLLTRGTWSQVSSMLITLFIMLLVLKGLLGQAVENRSHTVIHFGPEAEEESVAGAGNKASQRRQAA